jgi:pimeloyl-ACP methyl ester carboxylesterase
VLMHGCDPAVEGAILLSPSLRYSRPEHLEAWAASGKPVTALVPEFDDYLRPDAARERFAAIPQAEVIGVEGAKHLWVGNAERALDEIVARVAPETGPLPDSWDGPMQYADASAYADQTVAAFADVPMPEGPSSQ